MTENCSKNCGLLSEIVLNPTPNCNLSCAYCYDKWRDKAGIISMGDDVFDGVLRLLDFMDLDRVTLAFLGGEATILGIDYYQHFEDRFSDVNHHSHMQSNMTLLDDAFCEFLKKYKYTVGSSLDGVPAVHNPIRDNSFTESLRGIVLAQEYGILDKILCTITNGSMNHLEESFELFALLKVPTHFNAGSPNLKPKNYHIAMQKLFEMWYDFNRPFYGLQFDRMVERIKKHQWHDASNPAIGGCMKNAAQVDFNGNVVMCSQLAGYPEYKIGNVLTDHPLSILTHANRWNFYQQTKDIRESCKKCAYRWICSGGCFFNATSNKLNHDPYCGGGPALYRTALDRVGISDKEYRDMIPHDEEV